MPSEAIHEDWAVVREILEYRMLASAKEQHNHDASQMQPAQVESWKEMVEAVESDG